MFKSVEGQGNLVRDTRSNAVINNNKDEYQNFLLKQAQKKELEVRVKNVEDKLDQILILLQDDNR